jgi:protein-S-isoprenylcysteine O-methyltransferase Ste14
MSVQDLLANLEKVPLFELITMIITSLCVTLIFLAVFIDFMVNSTKEQVSIEKKSIVETGTMTLFFALYYIVLRIGVGRKIVWMFLSLSEKNLMDNWIYILMTAIGWMLLLVGTGVNIWGRIRLGTNWANHIKIYDQHTFVQIGPYRYVRHPLYSSLILMLFSGSLIYQDILLFVITLVIFVPMMIYRANQEEALLKERFGNYRQYQETVGQLCPTMKWRKK